MERELLSYTVDLYWFLVRKPSIKFQEINSVDFADAIEQHSSHIKCKFISEQLRKEPFILKVRNY